MNRAENADGVSLLSYLQSWYAGGTWATGQVQSQSNKTKVTNMMGRKKTLCGGRFHVEMPGQTETRLSGEMSQCIEIDIVEESVAEFRTRVAVHGAEIGTHCSTGYSFKSAAYGFENDVLQPNLMLIMEITINSRSDGKPVELSFHQDAALAPLDAFSSIRLRKSGAKPVVTEPKQVSLSAQTCLQSDNTVRRSEEVMFDIRRLDDRPAFKRQFIPSSSRNPIAKLVSTSL